MGSSGRLCAVLGWAVVAACSQGSTSQIPEALTETLAVPSPNQTAVPSVPIYVLDSRPETGPEIIGYGVKGSKNPRIISTPGLANPVEIAIDGRGVIYVGDTGTTSHQSSKIAEYKVGHKGALRTVEDGIAYPYGIAVSGRGTLYVANAYAGKYGDISVYPPRAIKPTLEIENGVSSPSAIAVDRSAYIYLANQAPTSPGGNVEEYLPKTKKPAVTVTDEINEPSVVTTDESNDLFVANAQGEVTEYQPHSETLARVIQPYGSWMTTGLVVDPLDDVYVAGAEYVTGRWYGRVAIYSAYSAKPLKTIHFKAGLVPTSIATDDSGDLYAAIPAQG